MSDLTDETGKPVKPLDGVETKHLRGIVEYQQARTLISSTWRKAVIAFAGLVAAGATIYMASSAIFGAFAEKVGL